MHLDFSTIKNAVEYGAILAGLYVALVFGVGTIKLDIDSRLVAHQTHGDFDSKEESMRWYASTAWEALDQFVALEIVQISQNDNTGMLGCLSLPSQGTVSPG